jgi:hypothetical protein
VTGGRPVRLTFPPYDKGTVDIMAGGRRAGIAMDEGGRWRAYLYPALTDRRIRVRSRGYWESRRRTQNAPDEPHPAPDRDLRQPSG